MLQMQDKPVHEFFPPLPLKPVVHAEFEVYRCCFLAVFGG